MNLRLLLLMFTLSLLGSCTSAYQTGQTPDDVYYSPSPGGEEYVAATDRDNRRYRDYEYDNPDDRWLRMRVRNPYRWNAFDNYDYFMPNPLGMGMGFGWGAPFTYNISPFYWNSVWSWNSFYNPYCTNVVFLNPKSNPYVYNNVKSFRLAGYTNRNYNIQNNPLRGKGNFGSSSNRYNNSNTSLGDSFKKMFSGSSNAAGYSNGNGFSPSYDRPARSYTPSSSGSSFPVRSSGGGGISRPGRGN